MCWLELRYGLMVGVNILKCFMGDESWDRFGVMSSWSNLMLFSLIFFLLSFFSIQLSLTTSAPLLRLRFHNFCPIVFSSFFFSLILPHRLVWPYLLLLWLSTHYPFSALIKAFILCMEEIMRRIHGYDITATTITTSTSNTQDEDLEMGSAVAEVTGAGQTE